MIRKHLDHIFLGFTFVLITVLAVYFRQPPYRYLPLCVSLIIYLLQSRVSRYAYLLGSLNSIFYAVVYMGLGVYASAASAMFFSFPLQLCTFFMWRKRADGHSTRLRRMGVRGYVLMLLLFAVAWTGLYLVLHALNSTSQILDNTSTLLGILVYFLTMFSFIEYTYLQIVGNVFSILLQASLLKDHPGQMTYMVLTLYATVFAVRAIFRAHALYKKQQKENRYEGS